MAWIFGMSPRFLKARPLPSRTTGFDYSEQRFVTLGLLNGIPVSIVHTETADHIHVTLFS